jgi:protocatechuate 3,4-dioxygenase beta subunit
MSRGWQVVVFVLTLLFSLQSAESAIVEGQALDPDGRPVPGAQVWGLGFEAGEYFIAGTAVAGTDGGFEIDNLPENQRVELYACQDGYSLGYTSLFNPRRRPIQVILAQGIRLSGRVRDPLGQPIEGAEVVANAARVDLEYNAPDLIPCSQATKALSKKDGTFNLGPLPPGIWTLNAKAEGSIPVEKAPLSRSWDQSSLTGIEIVLASKVTGTLTGRVLDPDGAPVAGAQVVLYSDGYFRSQTGEDGGFQLRGIPTGDHRVSAEYPSYSTGTLDLTVKEGENRADLRLGRKLIQIRGRVMGPEGQPIAGASVDVASGAGGTTQADGSFSAWLYPVSTNFISVWKSGYFPDPQSHQLRIRGDKPDQYVELRLYPATSVSGRIKGLSAEELTHVQVHGYYGERSDALISPKNGRVEGQVEADGRYRIDDLSSLTSEGIGIVAQTQRRTSRSVSVKVLVEPGQREAVADLEFPPTYPVRGRTLDPHGEPLVGVCISLIISHKGYYADCTREDGSFSLRVESGDYTMYLNRQGYVNEKRPGPIVRDAPVENLEIRMTPGGEIRGKIQGLELEEYASVSAVGSGVGAADQTDFEGNYQLSGLAPGDWEVTAGGESREVRGRISLQPGERAFLDLDLRLGPLTLSGRLLDDGKPAGYRHLELRSAEDPSFVHSSRTRQDGTFSFERLRAGTYQLQIKDRAEAEVLYEQEVDLTTARELVIDLAGAAVPGDARP